MEIICLLIITYILSRNIRYFYFRYMLTRETITYHGIDCSMQCGHSQFNNFFFCEFITPRELITSMFYYFPSIHGALKVFFVDFHFTKKPHLYSYDISYFILLPVFISSFILLLLKKVFTVVHFEFKMIIQHLNTSPKYNHTNSHGNSSLKCKLQWPI